MVTEDVAQQVRQGHRTVYTTEKHTERKKDWKAAYLQESNGERRYQSNEGNQKSESCLQINLMNTCQPRES